MTFCLTLALSTLKVFLEYFSTVSLKKKSQNSFIFEFQANVPASIEVNYSVLGILSNNQRSITHPFSFRVIRGLGEFLRISDQSYFLNETYKKEGKNERKEETSNMNKIKRGISRNPFSHIRTHTCTGTPSHLNGCKSRRQN